MDRITYYHILGVSSDASDEEILAAFRKKAKEWHPDVCNHPDAEERMREINRAAEILCDPEHRKRYDRALAGKAPFEKEYLQKATPKKAGRHSADPTRAAESRPVRGPVLVGFNARRVAIAGIVLAGILLGALILAISLYPAGMPVPAEAQGSYSAPAAPVPGPAASPAPSSADKTGDVLLAQGNYRGALAAYDAVIAENPAIAGRDFWFNRGMALQALGLYSEASASFDRALLAAPNDPVILAQKGAALIGLGRYNESLDYTDRALMTTPEVAFLWSNRGIALERLGDREGALAAFKNAGIPGAASGNDLYRKVVISPVSIGTL